MVNNVCKYSILEVDPKIIANTYTTINSRLVWFRLVYFGNRSRFN